MQKINRCWPVLALIRTFTFGMYPQASPSINQIRKVTKSAHIIILPLFGFHKASSFVLVINENKYSIYSLAMTSSGNLLASGSPENCVRLWDPRTCSKTMKLKGHTHNIRAILLNKDGTQCLSASSDHTIRLWSLSQQRCISTVEVHSDGVWALLANESFSKVYSGGKDCRVYMTDLRNPEESVLVCEDEAPILSVSIVCFSARIEPDSGIQFPVIISARLRPRPGESLGWNY